MSDVSALLQDAVNSSSSPAPTPNLPEYSGSSATANLPEFVPQWKQREVAASVPGKQSQVANAADAKKAEMGDEQIYLNASIIRRTGKGLESATPIERDLATLSGDQIIQKYGQGLGSSMILGLSQAGAKYDGLLDTQRSFGSWAGDTALDVAHGASSIASMGALGLGMLGKASEYITDGDDETGSRVTPLSNAMEGAGVAASQKIDDLGNWIDSKQSDNSQAHTQAQTPRVALETRDIDQAYDQSNQANANQYSQDQANGGGLGADLKNIGRQGVAVAKRIGSGALSSATDTLQDPTLLAKSTAQFGGSLIGAGPVSKGFGALSKAIVPESTRGLASLAAAIDEATGTPSVARAAVGLGKALPSDMLTSMGAVEAGGTYQGNAANVANMDPTVLKDNPIFQKLIAQGLTPKEAQTQMANNAGLEGAAIAAPLAMGVGALTGGDFAQNFLKKPFISKSIGHTGSDLVKETLHEGGLGVTDTLAGNKGLQDQVDPNKDLSDDVGQQLGSAALGGFMSGAVAQGPGVAKHALMGAGKATLNAAANQVASLGSKTDAASPVSDTNTASAGTAAQTAANSPEMAHVLSDAVQQAHTKDALNQINPEAAPTSHGSAMEALADKMTHLGQFDPKEVETSTLPDTVKAKLAGSSSRVDMMQKLAGVVNSQGLSTQDGLAAATYLHNEISKYQALTQSDPEAFAALPDEHPAGQLNEKFNQLGDMIQQSPTVKTAMDKIATSIAKGEADKLITPVTTQSLKTPEGQQNIANAAMISAVSPSKANLNANETILNHVESGTIKLTPEQSIAIKGSVAVMRAAKDASDQQQALGHTTKLNSVSKDILTNDTPKGDNQRSAAAYSMRIIQALKAGNVKAASGELKGLREFVKHMNNKVGALNTHYANGQGSEKVSNRARNPDTGDWYNTKDKARQSVDTTKPTSVEYAQRVSLEAKQLADIHNGLSKAFPELGSKEIKALPLHENLQGKPEDVVKAHQANPGLRSSLVQNPAKSEIDAKSSQEAKPAKVAEQNKTQAEATTGANSLTARSENSDEGAKAEETNTKKIEATPAKLSPNEKTTEAKPQASTTELSTEGKSSQGAEDELSEPKNTQEAYPNLYAPSNGKNWFHEAFTMATKATSRLFGVQDPLESLVAAFRTREALRNFMGKDLRGNVTSPMAKAVRNYLGQLPQLRDTLNQRLSEKLSSKGLGEKFSKGEELNRWDELKVLNLVEQQPDGSFKYNKALGDQALIAGLQWLLISNNFKSEMDGELVSALTGIPADKAERFAGMLGVGLSPVEAVRSLADKIVDFWGVNKNNNISKSYTDGIALAMAAEVLKALETTVMDKSQNKGKQTLLQIQTFVVDGSNLERLPYGEETKLRTVLRLVSNFDREVEGIKDPLFTNPTLIEEASLTEPKDKDYYADDEIPVAKSQMRNPIVKLTAPQKSMIEHAQAIQHFLNLPMHELYTAIKEGGLLELFGGGDTENRLLNDQHRISLEGQNKTVQNAWRALSNRVAYMSTMEGKLGEIPIRYAFGVSSVGRLQMLGAENPQASKLVREVVLPTWSTVDLSNQKDRNLFSTAVAQALGVKIQKNSTESNITKVNDLLGKFKDTLEMLTDHLNDGRLADGFVNTIKAEFNAAGVEITPNALHALQEYARSQTMSQEEQTKFRTGLYIEADGVTNGVANAMQMLTSTHFTDDQIANFAKTGLYFANSTTMNEHQAKDSVDLYSVAANKLRSAVNTLYKNASPEIQTQMNHLLTLMSLLVPKVEFDVSSGNLTVDRGITKNPLTITLYGSGAKGIAGKITDLITEKLYEKLSTVAQAVKADENVSFAEAMFGDQSGEGAEDRMAKFAEALNGVITQTVDKNMKELSVISTGINKLTSINPVKFVFGSEALDAIRDNVLHLFVTPMRQGISETVGKSLLESAKLLRSATQVQSIVLQYMFKERVDAAMAKRASLPGAKSSEFLSENELTKILHDLLKISPLITTGEQSFFPVKNDSADYTQILGRGLNGELRTPAQVNGPSDAGVKGLPMLNIGMGDGSMIQHMMNNAAKGLPVFDGFNFGLDKVNEGSHKANEAVFNSWQGNPLRAVLESYEPFMKSVSKKMLLDNPKLQAALAKALLPEWEREASTPDTLVTLMTNIQDDLSNGATMVDARHKVMSEYQSHTDQMAGAQQPFFNEGKVLIGSDAEIAKALNARLDDVLEGKSESPNTKTLVPTELSNVTAKFNPDQRKVWDQITKVGGLDGYRMVSGTRAEIEDYRAKNGLSTLETGNNAPQTAKGFIDPGSKMIYLVSASPETMLHEAIHAATFNMILTHYENGNLGKNAAIIQRSVGKLESLMGQFLKMEPFNRPQAFYDASQAIRDNLDKGTSLGKAMALNEFMAWTLANQDLTDLLKNTKANLFVQMTKNVLDVIRSVIWGRDNLANAPKAFEDMLSNIRFNTSVIIQEQPSIADMNRNVMLSQNEAYGSDARMSDLNSKFDQIFGRFMNTNDPVQKANRTLAVEQAANSAAKLANLAEVQGFSGLSLQAHKTFHAIVQALSLEMQLSPNSLSTAEELYRHTMKQLTSEMLIDHSDPDDQRAQSIAQNKFNMLLGNSSTLMDGKLLPVFMGLAAVDEGLRSVLSEIALPKSEKNQEGTVEAWLSNLTTNGMDSLAQKMSGQGKAKNVQSAIDALTSHMAREALDSSTFMNVISAPNAGINAAEATFLKFIEAGTDKVIGATQKVEKSNSNKVVKTLARVTEMAAKMATSTKAKEVQEHVMSIVNQGDSWTPVRDAVRDIIGRTNSNGSVYDLIKVARAMVQKIRQQYRDQVPGMIAKQFTRQLTKAEWSSAFMMGKTDIASLADFHKNEGTLDLLANPKSRAPVIRGLEKALEAEDVKHWPLVKAKADQLANWMVTKKTGVSLLRNADAVAMLLLERKAKDRVNPSSEYVKTLDRLITLYALDKLSPETQEHLTSLVQTEPKGMDFALSYLRGQRSAEMAKSTGMAKYNSYKGYIPSLNKMGVSMIIAKDSDGAKLLAQSYIRFADYKGSKAEGTGESKGYYYLPVSARAAFTQGIMQNIQHSAGGVDKQMGHSLELTAGVINNPVTVAQIAQQLGREGKSTTENLMPIFNKAGRVVAFERSVDPSKLTALDQDTNLARMVGVWRGRQVEEQVAQEFNRQLIDKLHAMYKADLKSDSANRSQYIDLLNSKSYGNDKIIKDAIALMTPETRAYAKELFGDKLMVRRDLVNDVIGYRKASIGDAWTGTSRWSPETQAAVKNVMMSLMGNKAYQHLINAEGILKEVVGETKSLIMIKSLVMPAINIASDTVQLITRGVALSTIMSSTPKKVAEVLYYVKGNLRRLEAEGELRAAQGTGDHNKQLKLKAELQSIQDGAKRLSIWPLIEAGEFGLIADLGNSRGDLDMVQGKMHQFIEKLTDKLPPAVLKAGNYALIGSDTPLYEGIQKTMEYGDFIMKALYYDHLMKKPGMTTEKARGEVSEEFVNFDRTQGRFRGTMEELGLAWFYNYKLRSAKIALSMVRDNPLHTLLGSLGPVSNSSIGIDKFLGDNIFGKALEGNVLHSVGPGMLLRAPMMHPLAQLLF